MPFASASSSPGDRLASAQHVLCKCVVCERARVADRAVSGAAPKEPVVSKKSGLLYERRLIDKYIDENGKVRRRRRTGVR